MIGQGHMFLKGTRHYVSVTPHIPNLPKAQPEADHESCEEQEKGEEKKNIHLIEG